jgi:hypothetical protein
MQLPLATAPWKDNLYGNLSTWNYPVGLSQLYSGGVAASTGYVYAFPFSTGIINSFTLAFNVLYLPYGVPGSTGATSTACKLFAVRKGRA